MLKFHLKNLIILIYFLNYILCDKIDNKIENKVSESIDNNSNNNNSNNNHINKINNNKNNNTSSNNHNNNYNNNNDYYDEDVTDVDDFTTDTSFPTDTLLDYPIGGYTAGGPFGGFNLREIRRQEFAEEILFFIVKNGNLIYSANGTSFESMENMNCNIEENFTVIIHGWREQADTEWIPIMVTNFSKKRGGCIVIVDYGLYALGPYLRLVQKYDQITSVIYSKMALWQRTGLKPSKVHMFGFSFGARIALAIGKKFGSRVIKSIDACDTAGPGFDMKFGNIDYKNSAENVQCIHTSRDKGTRYHTNCHQNWRIGYCGFNQPGASEPPYGSHGLCPYYYNLAFTHDFMAHKKPDSCSARNPARNWPENFKMGYMEARKSEVIGELFVPVSADPPYAMPLNHIEDYDNSLMYGLLPNESMDRIRGFRRRRPIMEQLRKIRRNMMNRRRRFTQTLMQF